MMTKALPSRLRPYGVALMAVAIASALRLLLEYLLEGSAPLLSFILAVMFSAWHGGLGPGLFATALSILVSAYLFFEPFSVPVFNSITNRTRFILFSVMGVFISVLCGSLLRAKERAERDALRAR